MEKNNETFTGDKMKNDNNDIVLYVRKVADMLCGEFKTSNAGVPHIIFKGKSFKYSAVYLARTGQWKIFYPYPSTRQTRVYFKDFEKFLEYLMKEELI